ncbi:MAG TPA: PAS domain S-box protein [Blastocatellia bacterium]|nr:PAS domain S-box protein [Blastocatellia bacterium]
MKSRVDLYIRIGLIVALLILIIGAVISYREAHELMSREATVRKTYEAIAHLEETLTTVDDAETSQRGYIITGQEEYLEPYRQALAKIPSRFDRLGSLIADSENQRANFALLKEAIDARLAVIEETIRLRREKGFAAAQAMVLSGVGRRRMEAIRDIAATMKAEEERLLTVRSRESQATGRNVIFFIVLTTAGAFLLVGVVFFLIRRGGSERRHSEAALRASESRLAGIIDSAMDAIITIDRDQRVLIFNHAAERIFGCPASAAVGQPIDRFIPERFRAAHRQHVRNFDKTNVTTRAMGKLGALTGLRSDGTEFPIEASISQIEEGGQKFFTVILRDISERQLAEQALLRSELRYRELFENANDLIYTHDLQGRFTSVNRTVERVTGYSRDEIIGRGYEQFIPPEYRSVAAENTLKKLHGEAESTTYEVELIAKDGRRIPVEVSSRLIYEGGQPVGVQGIARDVSERRRAEAERRELEEQLLQAQKMESVGRLAGGIAHDFNNLLTGIIGFSQLLQFRLDADDPMCQTVSEIERAGRRAADLTRQLLVFSRRQQLERRSLDLNETINGLTKLLKRVIGEDVEIRLNLDADLPPIFADAVHVEQVIMNLAVNARDAMPGGGQLLIETRRVSFDEAYCHEHLWARPGDYAQLAVTDTGAGMDAETLQHIFEPFFTTKGMGKGTGLGLAVVYGVVKQHDGFLRVDSEPGRGTTFNLYFAAHQESAKEVSAAAPVLRGGSETILVAEDEEALRHLAKNILSVLGYDVLLAKEGEEALRICQTNGRHIDLIVTDLVMPRMSGQELYERLRAAGIRTPVLFVTGYSAEMAQTDFLEKTGAPLLRKPYGLTSLGAKVREVIDTARARAAG